MDKRKIYLIGNAHLDPVWLWRWQEGFQEIKATFQSALDRLDEFKDLVFVCAGASYYKWVEENCPPMFRRIQDRVTEGRWVLTGGWWLQPDCNLPSGESFARHALYGQRYFMKKFGRYCETGYNVDSFGHDGMLPQILKLSGLKNYVFMRPDPEENPDIPGSLFEWESPDGSRVLAYRIPFSYSGFFSGGKNREIEKLAAVILMARNEDMDLMNFFGVGNHGGGPTVKLINKLDTEISKKTEVDIFYSSLDEYFNNIRKLGQSFPVYSSDLQHHAVGCYSVISEIKRNNRLSENRLVQAEAFSVLADWLTITHHFPIEAFKKAWENVLFNQFHDILGGCSIESAYEDARNFHGESLSIAAREQNNALQKISWSINTDWLEKRSGKEDDWIVWEEEDAGIPIVIFNPLCRNLEKNLEIFNDFASIKDPEGEDLPLQRIRGRYTERDNKWAVIVPVKIPAMGYTVLRAYKNRPSGAAKEVNAEAELYSMENSALKVRFDPDTGQLSSLYDKGSSREFLKSAVEVEVLDDKDSDTWAHSVSAFTCRKGCFGNPEFSIIENGPLRTVIKIKSFYNKSWIEQSYILNHNSSFLEIRNRILWLEPYSILRIAVPCGISGNIKPLYTMSYGYIEKDPDGNEEPGHQWSALRGDEGALVIANRSCSGFSCSGSTLRMTVLRSAEFADHFGDKDGTTGMTDQGFHDFSFSLIPQAGDFSAAAAHRYAEELNTEIPYIFESYHKGDLPLSICGLVLDRDNISVSSIKESEDGESYIIRIFEEEGMDTDFSLRLPLTGHCFTGKIGAFEIKTISFLKTDHSCNEVNILED